MQQDFLSPNLFYIIKYEEVEIPDLVITVEYKDGIKKMLKTDSKGRVYPFNEAIRQMPISVSFHYGSSERLFIIDLKAYPSQGNISIQVKEGANRQIYIDNELALLHE